MPQNNADFWEFANIHQRFLKHKLCLAEEPGNPCNSPIIRAHTIPRCQLQKIAEDGHVYAFDASIGQLTKNGGKIAVKKFGIQQFSTLNCFCAKHDNSIFSDIEDVPLTFTPHQLALLHYRSIASELYRKIRSDEANFQQRQLLQKKRSRKNRQRIEIFEGFIEGTKLGLRDARLALADCASILESQSYCDLSACVVRFKQLPTIMTVGGFYPEFDFHGCKRQLLGNEEALAETISFNILASEGRAAVIFIWRKGQGHCADFAKSYSDQSPAHYTTLAIQTAFEHLENTCMRPSWWEGLKPIERKLLSERMQFSLETRSSRCLQYGGVTYDDWVFDDLRFVND